MSGAEPAVEPARLRVGCPVWAHAAWKGGFFTAGARRQEFLPQYASVFGAAEANPTFYGLPSRETVARWSVEAPPDFRFCFKFPRTITHDRQLRDAGRETDEFLERLAPLGARLGSFFLQLHSSFGAARLDMLGGYLRKLPATFSYAVEVRAPEFFDAGPAERALDALLAEAGVDRVNFDTRGLFASLADDEFTRDAKRKKPRVPLRTTVTARRPFVRFVGDPEIPRNAPLLDAWADVIAGWLRRGLQPYFFTHHPDDTLAPALARDFQGRVQARYPAAGNPPAWPAEIEAGRAMRQLELL
ncbi:MAG: hypothetical protein RIR76_1479 [Verrucomicrobiota bacterium]|jgi:uncharacterized protein YecE (DUF72 family)|nr:DUF72 domain-containing protein [Opitutaceae bacterium]